MELDAWLDREIEMPDGESKRLRDLTASEVAELNEQQWPAWEEALEKISPPPVDLRDKLEEMHQTFLERLRKVRDEEVQVQEPSGPVCDLDPGLREALGLDEE